MIIVTRKIEFDAAHRVMLHESKCKYLHGHRYVIEASFIAVSGHLDEIGRVVDFSVIKRLLGDWVDQNWDHNTILHKEDLELGKAIESNIEEQKVFYLPYNPTAENMAKYLFEDICPKLFNGQGVICHAIKIYETPNCSVIVN